MALTLSTAARNAACNAIVDLIDGGTGAGNLVFQTSGDAEVATLAFSATAFGNASNGTASAASISDDTNATGGTIAKWEAQDGDGTMIFEGSAGTSGEDINFSSLGIGAGDTVSVSGLDLTVPAS